MFINKEEIKKLFKEKKLRTSEDLKEFLPKLIKEAIETMYDGELTELLGYDAYDKSKKTVDNSRNGYSEKSVKSNFGEIDLEVPRDRNGDFDPQVVKKRQNDISGLEEHIISMYAKGMSSRDIQKHMEALYGLSFSPEAISRITDKVMEKAREWQNRPLEPLYAVIFLDAIFYKARVESSIKSLAVYAMIGIRIDGQKECLGIWIMDNESSKSWLTVLNELRNRGVEDVLIFSIDGLTGLADAIRGVYPDAEIQRCIVHQVRNSLKYVSYKDRKPLANDLKSIYTAPTEDAALLNMSKVADKWKCRYPNVIKGWEANWTDIATLFKYPPEIRKLIYTTNPIESFNSRLRKVTKSRSVFPTEDALFKLIYLAIDDISKSWNNRVRDWSVIYPQLCIFFEERIDKFTRC